MYFMDELVKQRQNELLQEAEIARQIKYLKANKPQVHDGLRNHMGDLFINSGLRLKGHHHLGTKRIPSTPSI